MKRSESTYVVVRSAGERTTEACVSVLKQIFPKENIEVIQIVPFSQALKVALEIGIRKNKEWLFCVDADVLVSEEGVRKLLKKSVTLDKEVFEIQGLILDKFFPVLRPAGNHLYRISYAEKAIELIPQEGTSLRPETDMLNLMSESGYPWVQCDAVIGIHDYEQFYADIYRKCFLQAHKHSWLLTDLEKYWNKMASSDIDFQIALWGSLSGKLYTDTVYVDKRFLEKEAESVLSIKQIKEKSADTRNSISDYVQDILNVYSKNSNNSFQERIFPQKVWNKTYSLTKPVSINRASYFGYARITEKVLHKIGSIFIGIGNKLQHIYKLKNVKR